MKICFKPRSKEIYPDEHITARSKKKEKFIEYFDSTDDLETLDCLENLDEFDVLDKVRIPFYKEYHTDKGLNPDGTLSLKGVFRELDEEFQARNKS